MNKEQLKDLLQLADDYYTINEDVLTQEDVDRINNLKSAIKSELGEQEMTTGDFAFWLNQHEDEHLKGWAVIVLDWDPRDQVPQGMADLSVQNARRAHRQPQQGV